MSRLDIQQLRARTNTKKAAAGYRLEPAEQLRGVTLAPLDATFDVFLCHAYLDAEVIFGLYLLLSDADLRVYVDWVTDSHLSRDAITPATAARLRTRIGKSRSLLYAASENANNSAWMPWELGFADAQHGRVAVLPVVAASSQAAYYRGKEYLGLYPYLSDTNGALSVIGAAGSPRTLREFVSAGKA